MPADLHTHSYYSDGTDAPADIIYDAKSIALEAIALTDHDTTAGWNEALDAAEEAHITFLPGTEFTTQLVLADGKTMTVHLLSYLHNPNDAVLQKIISDEKNIRLKRAKEIVSRLSQDYPLTWAQVEAQVKPDVAVGRPHIADALSAAKIVPDRSAAFAKLLHPKSKYYVRLDAIDPIKMVRIVREAGGVPVIAHPAASKRGLIVSDETIKQMAVNGLAGIEVFHRENKPSEQARLYALAKDLNLLVTGSSDYHGSGKPNRLGENTTITEVALHIIEQGSGTDKYYIA